jgi:multiple sugar transport system permease protein
MQAMISDERRKLNKIVSKLFIYGFLILLAFLFLLPVYGVITTALRPNSEIIKEGFWALPNPPKMDNFIVIFAGGKIQQFLFNTVLVTLPATALSISMGILAGYAFGKMKFRFDLLLFILIIAGMYIPPHVVLIPIYIFFNGLGLLDTITSIVIVHIGFGIPICTMVMTNFFRSLPNELRDVGMIDGCNDWQIMLRIMLPVAQAALVALAILQFTWIWNDFIWPLVLIKTEAKMTIQLGVLQLRGQYGLAWGTQAAAYLIATLPTLTFFLLLQKHFVHGMTFGAVKG